MKRLLLLMLISLLIFNYAQAQHVTDETGKTYYDEKKTKLKESWQFRQKVVISNETGKAEMSNVRHGKYFQYDEEGNLIVEGNYNMGKKHGIWKYFDADNKVTKTEEYNNDELIKTE